MTTPAPLDGREALRAWLIDQSEQAKVGAENPSGGSIGDTEAAFDRGARHMADATLTWISEHLAALPDSGERPGLDVETLTRAMERALAAVDDEWTIPEFAEITADEYDRLTEGTAP